MDNEAVGNALNNVIVIIRWVIIAVVAIIVFALGSYILHMFFYSWPILESSHTNAASACMVVYAVIGVIAFRRLMQRQPYKQFTTHPYRNDNRLV